SWLAQNPKGSIVKGTVTEVDARGAEVDLGGGITGYLRASELSRGRVEDARTVLKVGDEVEAKFTAVDRKNRSVQLSIKAKEAHEEQEAVESYKSESGGTASGTTLGELLKEQISNSSD
ncbi:MAG: S1 RNA-binding domain-containing protein, partial [Gammaproteobacteria bacterium]